MLASLGYSWIAAFVAFGTSFSLGKIFVRYHNVHSIASRTDKRRHNERPIPQIGGAAIAAGFFLGCLVLNHGGIEAGGLRLAYVLAAVGVAMLNGIIDDVYELRARHKLLGQSLVTLLLLLSLNGVETAPDRLLGQNSLGALALKWFWCMGILNSMNLIDGLDELASGIAMIALTFLTVAGLGDSPFHGPLMYVGVPSLIGFYVWNRFPARLYLGESGAQMAGILLFLASMSFRHSPSAGVDMVVLFLTLGVPILDTSLAIIRRLGRRTGLMVPDREHLHHRMGRLGLSHPNISRFLHGLAVYLCGLAYAYMQLPNFSSAALALAIAGLGINLFLLNLAEKKLYVYLANFASHMLGMLDSNSHESVSMTARQRSFERAGVPYVVFRLDLSHCVGNLLERSPGRIQSFYGTLAEAIRGNPASREVHFESSRVTKILQRVQPGESPASAQATLRADLESFELRERIDLGLHLGSISLLPQERERIARSDEAAA